MNARAQALEVCERLRSKLCAIVTLKLQFWNHLPYLLAGIYDGNQCESYRSKLLAGQCIQEWEDMVAQGME